MRAVEKRLRQRLKAAESRIEELHKDLSEIRTDRNTFREHFIKRMRWWIELMGQSKHPNMPWLVEDDAKWLQRFTWWSW